MENEGGSWSTAVVEFWSALYIISQWAGAGGSRGACLQAYQAGHPGMEHQHRQLWGETTNKCYGFLFGGLPGSVFGIRIQEIIKGPGFKYKAYPIFTSAAKNWKLLPVLSFEKDKTVATNNFILNLKLILKILYFLLDKNLCWHQDERLLLRFWPPDS